jgi:hypothetical protein
LVQNRIRLYPAREDVRPDRMLDEKIEVGIRDTDGVLMMWSQKASQSRWVHREYLLARQYQKRICLVVFPRRQRGGSQTPLPPGWEDRREYVPLEGVMFPLLAFATFHQPFENTLAKIRAFADELRKGREEQDH